MQFLIYGTYNGLIVFHFAGVFWLVASLRDPLFLYVVTETIGLMLEPSNTLLLLVYSGVLIVCVQLSRLVWRYRYVVCKLVCLLSDPHQ